MQPDRVKKACRFRRAFFLTGVLLVAACTGGSPLENREDVAARVARDGGLEAVRLRAGPFELQGYRRYAAPASGQLTVFIEGDGLAWNAFGTAPSPDPTPRDPVALRIAAVDASANRLYLARPCQYQQPAALARCHYSYWTSHRFAEEVVAGYAAAIEAQARGIGAGRIMLVGYSGGGAVAALVAPRLTGTVELLTIAAPLDHAFWTQEMKISPMTGSLNPADNAGRLATIPQVHFVAADAEIVPHSVT
ncbi:unnamed protein product, partial [Discosporangium mesarthrocarpum]